MSTGVIIAIVVVVALILLALLFFLPRMREKARVKKRERELHQRREAVAGEHREVADSRQREAEEAERQRAEADLHQEKAAMHQRGDADHELIDERERDKFAGTSAMSGGTTDRDRAGADDRAEGSGMRDETTTPPSGDRTEFEQGRQVGHEEERSGRFAPGQDQPADSPGSRRA